MTAAGVVALSASLQRLIDLIVAFEWCGDAELQKQVYWCLALLQPSRTQIDKLGEALDEISKDQPSSLLDPRTGCPPGKAIIQSAIAAYEAREVERSIMDVVGAGHGMSFNLLHYIQV